MKCEKRKVAQGRVPKLRFPEFRGAGEWEEKRLEDICVYVSSGKDRNDPEGVYELYGSTGIIGKSTNASYDGEYILVARVGANAGQMARAKGKFGVTDNTLVILPSGTANLCFILLALENFNPRKLVFGSGQPLVTGGQLKVVILHLPETSEQQKIADCLSSLDELITLHTQKLDSLKTRKNGLMQQLFPAEGETVPKLRFAEFQGAGEWEERKLENLAKRGSGHTPSKSYAEYYNGGIKWVSLADTNRLDNGLILDTTKQISELGIKNSSAVLYPLGTVILSRDAGVGKSAVIGCPMAVSQHFIAWVCHPSQLHNWFLYYVLQNNKPLFERVAMGSTIKTIGLPFFVKMLIVIPSLPEQQKIASCLSSLDELITAQTQKLATLKTHKKGLMQGLFPPADEVNA